jgi:hypothetical protein
MCNAKQADISPSRIAAKEICQQSHWIDMNDFHLNVTLTM